MLAARQRKLQRFRQLRTNRWLQEAPESLAELCVGRMTCTGKRPHSCWLIGTDSKLQYTTKQSDPYGRASARRLCRHSFIHRILRKTGSAINAKNCLFCDLQQDGYSGNNLCQITVILANLKNHQSRSSISPPPVRKNTRCARAPGLRPPLPREANGGLISLTTDGEKNTYRV